MAAPADPARAERQNRPRPERNAIDRTDGPRPVRTEAEAQRPDRAGRPFKARDGAPERAPRDDARNRPPGARDGRGPRPDQREARPSRPESQAPRPDRQPDPDSPFAKLAALKAQLEGQRKP